MRKMTWLLAPLATLATVMLAALLPSSATSAVPATGTVSPAETSVTWTGGPALISNPTGVCVGGLEVTCDRFLLTIVPPATGEYSIEIGLTMTSSGDDWDLFVYGPNGFVGSSTNSAGNSETVRMNNPVEGTYRVYANPWLVDPGSTVNGKATMNVNKVYPPSSTGSVLYDFDAAAPQAKLEVPLRVVMVGFNAADGIDASKVLGEIPNVQRPGVLIPRGTNPGGDSHPLLGAETLVNHGRSYFNNSTPFLVPYEYAWKPQLIYAPDEFTDGLLAAMKANSATGEFANTTRNRQYLETYNTQRGVYRGAENQVPANAPVRFVDGESVEEWIAANSQKMLGFSSGPKGGKGKKAAGVNPGYTVYVINTWDSAQAKTHLQPEHEYHVWKVNRKDPDTGEFDGIDWARVWGGHYRFMMVDLGAAPNPYEAETWANRNRTAFGSANYDPPLWEYRANAPRPVTLLNAPTEGVEQAVTPGETWDTNYLNFMLGRSVNQAASFRFLHSYLYEPWPGTGQYWFSDNVWHDANAELPWASDLTKLYNQDVVLSGMRTLTPYLTFAGDVKFQYLQQGGADYNADQAMLEEAKRKGDGIAGIPGTAMDTITAMDYLDSKPDRFLRGGPCYTTVPGINVVAEKHYAWYAAIVAGIAENRNGVPWGYLNSVNDVFKSGSADREETLRLAHPPTATGAFTYTAIHEASHYLGLAHPHDSVGATRNADGSPRYYDGFTWMYNSTAAPTTYSHTELTYNILDQDNIARGHAAYYLKWSDEALQDGGRAYYDSGKQTLADIPPEALSLRSDAINFAAKAEKAFASWDFANAVFAAQASFRAAAAYRDLARGLAPGTTELEKGTKKAGAESCPSGKK